MRKKENGKFEYCVRFGHSCKRKTTCVWGLILFAQPSKSPFYTTGTLGHVKSNLRIVTD